MEACIRVVDRAKEGVESSPCGLLKQRLVKGAGVFVDCTGDGKGIQNSGIGVRKKWRFENKGTIRSFRKFGKAREQDLIRTYGQ